MDRLEKQMNFILEVEKIKKITRQTYVSDGSRQENDAEHSWSLAIMCMLLSEYANEEVNAWKVMSMVLIHDIVEIDAGDTYAYDEIGNLSKRSREEAAADRIFRLLPRDQAVYMRGLWEEFEAKETPEAEFAAALDKIQPLLLNHITGGRAWKEHEVKASQIFKRNKDTPSGSQELWKYSKALIEKNIADGIIEEA